MPITMSSAIETVPQEKRGAAMGIYQAVYGVGMFLGPVIAGHVIEYFSASSANSVSGYSANFHVFLAVSVVGAILSVLLLHSKAEK